jgi:glycosyltransferase involved in cell wall biosynthesis
LAWPLREGPEAAKARGHTNAYEICCMAQAWTAAGFRTEVCDFNDTDYRPSEDCRVAIDIHGNLEKWHSFLPGSAMRVLHATGCHWEVQNAAETNRLAGLRERRGVALQARRQVSPNSAPQVADEIAVLGNEFTIGTFAFAAKPVMRIPISSACEFAWPEGRDFAKAQRRILWMGSYGMVHKGLDLVLEAFAGMPDLQLTVCGRPEKEEDFFQLYERELKFTPNIKTAGWIDLSSPQFAEIARTHAAVIYPSCAEGGGGTVIHCMHAGLIPVCTREASVDLEDFGLAISDGSVAAIRTAARRMADLNPEEVEERAAAARDHARRYHTRETFALNYGQFVRRLSDALPAS